MPKTKKNKLNKKLKGFLWKSVIKTIALLIVLTVLCSLLYCLYLSVRIDKRFSGRRWSIPSKVFSDITLLYPGQQLNRELFNEKLLRLGYHDVPHPPKSRGDLYKSESHIDIFLHDLVMPSRRRSGMPVQIVFSGNTIESIKDLNTGESIPILELEPEEITRFYGPELVRRKLISINDAPQHLIYAVLAAEDKRFYKHYGLDPIGIFRAIYINLRFGSIRQGGSTITQQLAKNYFLSSDKTLTRKLNEFLMSMLIELMYKKNEILEIYLNEIYFGQKGPVSINGIGEAAFFYFDKSVSDLSLEQSATLAGLIKAPNRYSPYVDPDRSRDQRNLVLRAMHDNGWISDEQMLKALPLPVKTSGFAPHRNKAQYFIDYLTNQLQKFYPSDILSSFGLSIYTTLDTQVQMAAEMALEAGLKRLETSIPELIRQEPLQKIQGAIIVMQPKTGRILSIVGGRNYSISQFNRITQARRQPGSAFKPFVYVSSLDKFTPASKLSNIQKSYPLSGKLWTPNNFSPVSEKRISMRNALAKSINLATVDMAMQVGLDNIISMASRFGFSTSLRTFPSIALGSFEVVPIELATAYCVFAADGVLPYPLALNDVVDENGTILQRRHIAIKSILSPAKAFIMSSMLRSVVTDGTARSLKGLGIALPVCGKTGTTNNFRDAWFVGYTPDILALVWVGFDNGDSIFSTGAGAALPIWADLIKSIPQYISGNFFTNPPGVVKKIICVESGQLAIAGQCPETIEEFILSENMLEENCSFHKHSGSLKRILKGVKDLF